MTSWLQALTEVTCATSAPKFFPARWASPAGPACLKEAQLPGHESRTQRAEINLDDPQLAAQGHLA